LIYFR